MTSPLEGQAASTCVIRETQWQDIEHLVALDRQLFAEDAWSTAAWWAELALRPRRECVCLLQGDVVVGYGGIDHGGESADIMTIAIAPAAQGQGLSRRVLAELEHRAAVRGATHGLLEVRSDNLAARSLYATAGWHQLHVRRRYYQPGDVDALILGKTLADKEIRP